MPKLLDYGGLSYLWQQIDRIKQDKLTIDTELDATSHNPVENMAIKLGIDALKRDMEDQTDSSNTLLYELYSGVLPYAGSGTDPENDYICKCYCVRNNATVTLYFNIEGTYGAQTLPITNLTDAKAIPADCRPFVDITNLVAQSQSGFNNISVSKTDGQILITSNDGVFNTHCAITYLVLSAGMVPDPSPAEEDLKYTVKARMIKIGEYFPTYNSTTNTISNYTLTGAALTTDATGTMFSGYEGNYTVYLQNASTTYAGSEQFYWSKKFGDTIDSTTNKGSLFTFNQCFEAASNVDEDTLIAHGCQAIEELAETGNTIQYFVTSFGKNAWIGGVNSPYNAAIKSKAYGYNSEASYNGRFYWTDCILAHMLRFVPVSAEQYISDKTRPIERDGDIIGYVDKVVPLKLIEKAYSWGNFDVVNGTTWRGAKLFCEDIETPSSEILSQKFSGHLVIEDWNKSSTTGNRFGNLSSYYQRIDSKLNEEEHSSGGGYPEWWTTEIQNSYAAALNNIVSQLPAAEIEGCHMDQYIDIASCDINDVVYVNRIYRDGDEGTPNVVETGSNSHYIEFDNSESSGLIICLYYDSSTSSWKYEDFAGNIIYEGNPELVTIELQDSTACIENPNATGEPWAFPASRNWASFKVGGAWPAHYAGDYYRDISIKEVNGVVQSFVCGATVPYNTPHLAAGTAPVVSISISQSPVNRRPGSSWEKTSYKLDTYDNSGHEFD